MRVFVCTIIVASGFGIAGGCGRDVSRNDVTSKREESREAQKEADQAKAKAAEKQHQADLKMADAIQVEAKFLEQENKKDYERDMRYELDQMKERLDAFKSSVDKQKPELKAEQNVAATHLKELYNRAEQRLSDVKSAKAEDWSAAKQDANVAWRELVANYNDESRRFR